jgi:two-component system OmpR family response regulator
LRWEAEVKLLLVEDDAKIAGAIKRGLEGEGFDVEVAADGNEGLWRATEHRYDLIVLDILLPGRNGYQVCAELRAAGDWTPILMLTAKDGDLDEAEALDAGADDYLTKPFSFPVLVARVRALLRRVERRPAPAGGPLHAGALAIDAERRRVHVGPREVHLTPTEFDLLALLAARPGVVFTRDQLLAEVWGWRDGSGHRTVDSHVRGLRRKLGAGWVRTVQGVGYALEPAEA